MIDYYEQLTQEEKEEVTDVIHTVPSDISPGKKI